MNALYSVFPFHVNTLYSVLPFHVNTLYSVLPFHVNTLYSVLPFHVNTVYSVFQFHVNTLYSVLPFHVNTIYSVFPFHVNTLYSIFPFHVNTLCLVTCPGAPPDFHKSTVDLVKLGQQYADSDSCSSLTSQATAHSPSQPQQCADSHSCSSQATAHSSPQPQSQSQDMEESVDDRDAIGDLLDEAMESDTEEASTSAKPPVPVMVSGYSPIWQCSLNRQ